MSGKSQQIFEDIGDDEFAQQIEDQQAVNAKEPESLSSARNARRRLEDYWAKKALDEELRHIDDWEDGDD